jgi:hypothetical protein
LRPGFAIYAPALSNRIATAFSSASRHASWSSCPKSKNSRNTLPVMLWCMAFSSLETDRLRWMNVGPRRPRGTRAEVLAAI